MDNFNEDEFLRLNKKIKDLLAYNEKTLSLNFQLEKLNKKYLDELNKTKEEHSRITESNLQLRLDLDKTNTERDNIYEALQKQKVNLNELVDKCREQNNKIKMLQDALGVKGTVPYISEPRKTVQIIGSIAELNTEGNLQLKIKELENKLQTMEHELRNSYDIIDELEFEIDGIDILEVENERLNEEIQKLYEQINKEDNYNNRCHEKSGCTRDHHQHNNHNKVVKQVSDKQTRRNLLQKKLESYHEKQIASADFVKLDLPPADTTSSITE